MLLSDARCAYIAGFFDGEGHCGLGKQRAQKYYWAPNYCVNVSIRNTNKATLDMLQKYVQLGFVSESKHNKVSSKRSYQLWFPVHHVVKFLRLIEPHVLLKAEQVKLVIEYCMDLLGHTESEVMKARREAIYVQLLKLNERGL